MPSKNIKHVKIKNTGLLFESLARQITVDALEDKKSSVAASIIKENFSKTSELRKELDLYQKLIKNSFSSDTKASSYIDIIVEARRTLNNQRLRKEKYNVIKVISESFDVNKFFQSRIDNYPVYASIYKLFEYNILTEGQYKNPNDLIECKFKIVEHLTRKVTKPELAKTDVSEILEKENMSIRLLTQKIIIDDFNKKFSNKLNENQKSLIRDYINGITSTNSFMDSVNTRIPVMTKEMNELSNFMPDPAIQIKLQELANTVSKLKGLKSINDNQMLALLKLYDLLEQIKANVKKYKCEAK